MKASTAKVNKRLRESGLGGRLQITSNSDEWLRFLDGEAATLCQQMDIVQAAPTFTFTTSKGIQARFLSDVKVIALSKGIFDFLCKLSAQIVTAGLFNHIGNPERTPSWKEDAKRSKVSPRDVLEAQNFDFQNLPWKQNRPRVGLFAYLLLTFFRFIVLHEMAHYFHRHDVRGAVRRDLSIKHSRQISVVPTEAIASQACELLADRTAIFWLNAAQENDIVSGRMEQGLFSPLASMVNTLDKRGEFNLSLMYVLFVVLDDRPVLDPAAATRQSHPPGAFRYVTLASTLTQEKEQAESAEAARRLLLSATQGGDRLVAMAFNRDLDVSWIGSLQTPILTAHYQKLHREVPRWSRDRAVPAEEDRQKVARYRQSIEPASQS